MRRAAYLIVGSVVLAAISQSALAVGSVEEAFGFEPQFFSPDGHGMKNLKTDYGAKGDGVTDDTAAFVKAFSEDTNARLFYIPPGTYLLRDQIAYGRGKKKVCVIGGGRSKTILKLADGSAGFDSASKPKVFFYARNKAVQGEQNFFQYVYHLTIEIGKNNPGAIGLNFHTNNSGAVKDVAIRATDPVNSPGHVGLACVDWSVGPGNARYVTVDGFTTGLQLTGIGNYFVAEHITVKNCRTAVVSGSCPIRDLTTENCELGVKVQGQVLVLDSEIKGRGEAAIDVSKGSLLARNVKTAGFAIAIKAPGGNVPGPQVGEYFSKAAVFAWAPAPGMNTTLNLPVEQSPELPYPASAADWTVIDAKGDISGAIQNAIDSGKTDILICGFPTISKTIVLRNNVRRVMGLGNTYVKYGMKGAPAWRLEDGKSPVVIMELLYVLGNCEVAYEQASKRTWVMRHGFGTYRNTPEAHGGKVFMESLVGDPFVFTNMKAWLRDMNTEGSGGVKDFSSLVNDGGSMWILGQKAEDYITRCKTTNGGFTELLGGSYEQNWDGADFKRTGMDINNRPPLYIVENANFSATYTSWGGAIPFDPILRETRGSESRDAKRAQAGGSAVLLVGYTQRPAAANAK